MLVQASINGYSGRPATVVGFLDFNTQLLFIKKSDELKQGRFSNSGLITNVVMPEYDRWFDEGDFGDAVAAFREFDGSGRLHFDKKAERSRPTIQVEKISENGSTLSISSDITNEQVAVIAICLLAKDLHAYHISNQLQDFILTI